MIDFGCVKAIVSNVFWLELFSSSDERKRKSNEPLHTRLSNVDSVVACATEYPCISRVALMASVDWIDGPYIRTCGDFWIFISILSIIGSFMLTKAAKLPV